MSTNKSQAFENLSQEQLIELSLKRKEGILASNGALLVTTGKRTGRSPHDRFIVDDELTHSEVDWGEVNKPFERAKFNQLWSRVGYSDQISELTFNQNDYYNRIIKESKNADIIIVNHSLLCSDLSSNNSILPDNSILVIDEGHNLVPSIRNHLTNSFCVFTIQLIHTLKVSFIDDKTLKIRVKKL